VSAGVTSKPALPLGPVVFITGYEVRPNGAHRIYVGPRYKGRYILLPPSLPLRSTHGAAADTPSFSPSRSTDSRFSKMRLKMDAERIRERQWDQIRADHSRTHRLIVGVGEAAMYLNKARNELVTAQINADMAREAASGLDRPDAIGFASTLSLVSADIERCRGDMEAWIVKLGGEVREEAE
jgi:hypothetical protein